MRRLVTLLIWIVGILFPMGWFAHLNTHTGTLFEVLFQPQWTHVVMHMVLYGVLTFMLATEVSRRERRVSMRRIVVATLAAAMVVAIAQECVQLFYQSRVAGSDELFDVGVDLVGAGVGLIVFLGVFTRDRFSLHSRDDVVG